MEYKFSVEVSVVGDICWQELLVLFQEERQRHPARSIGRCFPTLSPEQLEMLR
ncbi:hypothetical protein B484DRAFT_407591 [Ochromonadaceae sp. CCMP2298]|nr:hypothetical protein B484DRAFT_407591 [Ochromonadaceae sp. CCMP2298]